MTTINPGDVSLTPSFKLRQYPVKGQLNFAEWTFKPMTKGEMMLSMFLGTARPGLGNDLIALSRRRLEALGFVQAPIGTDIDRTFKVQGKEDGGSYTLLGPALPAGEFSRSGDFPLLLVYMNNASGELFIRYAEDFEARMVAEKRT